MPESRSSGEIVVTVGDRPVREPDAQCEGCGARGTVGRATRHLGPAAERVEEHRFCAQCWPEWSAFYRARWEEQSRRLRLAWLDHPREAPPPPRGMSFESATWHGTIEYVRQLTMQARAALAPRPSLEAQARLTEDLARAAAAIRAGAAEREGPMPIEVRAFLAEFERPPDPDARAGC
jgi:hypothetical protein